MSSYNIVEYIPQLDESTVRWDLKSPWSLSDRNKLGHDGHEWPTSTPFVQCQSTLPFWGNSYPWPRPCVWSEVKVTLNLENPKIKVMAKVKSGGHIWGLECNRYVCFSFRGNQTTFWLRYSKFHIWPWKFNVKVMAKMKLDGRIWGLEFNRYVCSSFRGNRTIFGWDIANSIFDLENSRSRSRRKSIQI